MLASFAALLSLPASTSRLIGCGQAVQLFHRQLGAQTKNEFFGCRGKSSKSTSSSDPSLASYRSSKISHSEQRLQLEEHSADHLVHGEMSPGMFERRESSGSGSSMIASGADGERKRPFMIGVAGGTASGKVRVIQGYIFEGTQKLTTFSFPLIVYCL